MWATATNWRLWKQNNHYCTKILKPDNSKFWVVTLTKRNARDKWLKWKILAHPSPSQELPIKVKQSPALGLKHSRTSPHQDCVALLTPGQLRSRETNTLPAAAHFLSSGPIFQSSMSFQQSIPLWIYQWILAFIGQNPHDPDIFLKFYFLNTAPCTIFSPRELGDYFTFRS